MKIEKRWTVPFKNVRNGQVFDYLGSIYMRVAIVDDVGRFVCNAVNLENCNYTIVVDDARVLLYESAKVVLE
jgi:hypothetical protein